MIRLPIAWHIKMQGLCENYIQPVAKHRMLEQHEQRRRYRTTTGCDFQTVDMERLDLQMLPTQI